MKRVFPALLFGLFFLLTLPVLAQNQAAQLRVIRTTLASLPSIDVTLFAQDDLGNAIDLTDEFIAIKHKGVSIDNAAVIGSESVGTFTIFLLDLPSGVAGQIDTIKNSVQTYASQSFMQEQVDYVAVYRVDEISALEMLSPTFFHNDVTNLFALGVETESGSTALIDSIGDILSRVESLRPSPDLPVSLVVISDGTDAVSQQFSAEQLYGKAQDKGVKIFTLIVENKDLVFSAEEGQTFMESLAEQTGGGSSPLSDITGTKILWNEILSFSEFPVVRYTPEILEAGTAQVEISLPNYPQIAPVFATIDIPATLPQISIDLSPSMIITVEELVTPLSFGLPTTVTWLDGEVRTITQAQLWVNGSALADIEPATLARIKMDVPLNFGENRLHIVVVDDAGQTAKSPEIKLDVQQGTLSIPREIRGGGGIPWRIVIYVLVCVVIIGLLIYLFRWYRQSGSERVAQNLGGWRKRRDIARAERKQTVAKPTPPPEDRPNFDQAPSPADESTYAPNQAYTSPYSRPIQAPELKDGVPKIEILDARSSISATVPVNRTEFLIGRSPTVDLALTEDSTVSRIHATIVEDNGIYRIYDEQSTSGTYVNDREVPEYGLQLSTGDEIHIGAVHLRFRL